MKRKRFLEDEGSLRKNEASQAVPMPRVFIPVPHGRRGGILRHHMRQRGMNMTKWTEDDIGKMVTITFEHGTEIEDTIVCVPLEMMALRTLADGTQVPEMLGDGQPIIGPSIEVGMIHARLTHSLPLVKMQEERAKEMADAIKRMEEEDEEVKEEE